MTRTPLVNIQLFLFLVALCSILSAVTVLIFNSLSKRCAGNIDLVFSRRNLSIGPTATVIASLLAVLFTFNEMAPYLGIKKRFSHKMWSNLRVDDYRWNSLVFPESIRLSNRMDDQLIELSSVRVEPKTLSLFPEGYS